MLEWETQWKLSISHRLFISYSLKFCELICYKCRLYIAKVAKNMAENNHHYHNFPSGLHPQTTERLIQHIDLLSSPFIHYMKVVG